MAHSLTPAAPAIAIPVSTRSKHAPLSFQRAWACHESSNDAQVLNHVHRRSVAIGLVGVVMGLNEGDRKANAAEKEDLARREKNEVKNEAEKASTDSMRQEEKS